LHNLRLRTPLRVTFGNHGTCTKKKTREMVLVLESEKNAGNGCATSGCACAHPILPREPQRGHVPFDDVTSGEKAPLWRILRHFRLRMRAPNLPREPQRGHVTFDDVTSGQKALLGWILCNFRLHMCRTYIRSRPLPVT